MGFAGNQQDAGGDRQSGRRCLSTRGPIRPAIRTRPFILTRAPDGPDLFVPDELKWMVDFDRAVAAGMAMAIDLTPDQAANGFDLLLVLGLQLSACGRRRAAALQELLLHHQTGRSGFALLPQGTPAHNSPRHERPGTRASTTRTPASTIARTCRCSPRLPMPRKSSTANGSLNFSGIDPAFVATVHASNAPDQKQARAMQTAHVAGNARLLDEHAVHANRRPDVDLQRRDHRAHAPVLHAVRQRARCLPAVRIGGQPYGILPTTAFSRIQWYQPQIFPGAPCRRTNFMAQPVRNSAPDRRRLDDDGQHALTGSVRAAIPIRRC